MPDPKSATLATFSPSDEDLHAAVLAVQKDAPDVGASKLHAAIAAAHPDWVVSEKRLRKTLRVQRGEEEPPQTSSKADLQSINGSKSGKKRSSAGQKRAAASNSGFPVSHLNVDLNPDEFSKKVQIKVFGPLKGKGLVASQAIKEGEVIWKEDPFVYCPDWRIQEAQDMASRCALCAHPIPHPRYPPIQCPELCGATWCNRLCAARAKSMHTFFCLSQNPCGTPLWRFIREQRWIALGAWARVVALLLGEALEGSSAGLGKGKDWSVVNGLAAMSLRERVKILPNWEATLPANEQLWKNSHKLFMEAFNPPSNSVLGKKLARAKKGGRISTDAERQLLGYDGFLVGLGKMSLNIEAHGGLYRFQSHLNHDCTPNVSVRHLEGPAQPGKITMIAKRDIPEGEELFITYVDPTSSVKKRRRALAEWGFGLCNCDRCVEEAKTAKDGDNEEETGGDLADELKGFLGVD